MKKLLSIILSLFLITNVFAQIADDGFVVPIHEDFTGNSSSSATAGESSPAESTSSSTSSSSAISQGIWIEVTSDNQSLIRDVATGEKSGYEFDNSHFLSNANWWMWGELVPGVILDAEISAWNFDKTLYQASSYALNVPTVTWGDGFQDLLSVPFAPLYGTSEDSIGSFNKMGFSVATPYINVKLGYGNLGANGMMDYKGIFPVVSRWNDVGKGFTELSLGSKLQNIGKVKLNSTIGLSRTRGTYGFYNVNTAKIGMMDLALTATSYTTEEDLFFYNRTNTNAISAYFAISPLDALKIEAHGIMAMGTNIDPSLDSSAVALKATFTGNYFDITAQQTISGKEATSVWGTDSSGYSTVTPNTAISFVDAGFQATQHLGFELVETFTINEFDTMEGLMTLRNQAILNWDMSALVGKELKTSVYGVMSLDKLAKATSEKTKIVPYFQEAGLQVISKSLPFANQLTLDYGIKMEGAYEDTTYKYDMTYNSIMLTADFTDNISVNLGSIIRTKSTEDKKLVPFGIAVGFTLVETPLPGNPRFWAHATYGMNPYESNNYTLYRADDGLNNPEYTSYLLNTLNEDTNISEISLGLIWNL